LITSPFVYDTAIRPAAGELYFDGYEQVQVTVKESSFPAWMKLIGPDPAGPDPADGALLSGRFTTGPG
jgi:hypothetical protein